MFKLNQPAYNFTLKNSEGKDVSLSDFIRKRAMLVFYPKDKSLVCTKQLCEYSNSLDEFENLGINVLAINTDSVENHKSFKESKQLKIELLSDIGGTISRKYGMLNLIGLAKRGIYFINENGIIKGCDVMMPLKYQTKDYLKKLITEVY